MNEAEDPGKLCLRVAPCCVQPIDDSRTDQSGQEMTPGFSRLHLGLIRGDYGATVVGLKSCQECLISW